MWVTLISDIGSGMSLLGWMLLKVYAYRNRPSGRHSK